MSNITLWPIPNPLPHPNPPNRPADTQVTLSQMPVDTVSRINLNLFLAANVNESISPQMFASNLMECINAIFLSTPKHNDTNNDDNNSFGDFKSQRSANEFGSRSHESIESQFKEILEAQAYKNIHSLTCEYFNSLKKCEIAKERSLEKLETQMATLKANQLIELLNHQEVSERSERALDE